jgi:hypothetical protein
MIVSKETTRQRLLEDILYAYLDSELNPNTSEAEETLSIELNSIVKRYNLDRQVTPPSNRLSLAAEPIEKVQSGNPELDAIYTNLLTLVLPSTACAYDPKKDAMFYEAISVKEKVEELIATNIISGDIKVGVNKIIACFQNRNGVELRTRANRNTSRIYFSWEIMEKMFGKTKEEITEEFK